MNFIGELSSVGKLRKNVKLTTLYLTGNPCTQFDHYREFVICVLPQLKTLDCKEIGKSERILAMQKFKNILSLIQEQEEEHRINREDQKEREENRLREKKERENETEDKEERRRKFFEEKSDYTPESKIEMTQVMEEIELEKETARLGDEAPVEKPARMLFMKDGRAFNINEPKITFSQDDSSEDALVLTLHVFKHLDTSLIDLDVQPTYVRSVIFWKRHI